MFTTDVAQVQVDPTTIGRRLKEMGICGRIAVQKLDFTAAHALLRLAFARRFIVYPDLFYDILIFSDEKTCGYVLIFPRRLQLLKTIFHITL